jgi:hypothetical protein
VGSKLTSFVGYKIFGNAVRVGNIFQIGPVDIYFQVNISSAHNFVSHTFNFVPLGVLHQFTYLSRESCKATGSRLGPSLSYLFLMSLMRPDLL